MIPHKRNVGTTLRIAVFHSLPDAAARLFTQTALHGDDEVSGDFSELKGDER